MTPYEQLVVATQENFSRFHAAYAAGGAPYELAGPSPFTYEQQIERLVHEIAEADCVLVGGASGLSAAGGGDFYYGDTPSFREHFGKFAEKYGVRGAFDGSFRRWETPEEKWAYLSTFLHTTQTAPVRAPYRDLDALLADKDFFVLTTNQDTQFVKLYPEGQVAQIQGDHRFFQCARCCMDDTWDAVEPVRQMIEAQGDDTRIPTASFRAARTAAGRRSRGCAATATSCRARSTKSSTARSPTGWPRTPRGACCSWSWGSAA